MGLWSAIEDEVKGGEVGDKVPPELGIDQRGRLKELDLNAFLLDEMGIEIFLGSALCKEARDPNLFTYIYKELISRGFNP